MGVRISWLIFAKKSDLASLAAFNFKLDTASCEVLRSTLFSKPLFNSKFSSLIKLNLLAIAKASNTDSKAKPISPKR